MSTILFAGCKKEGPPQWDIDVLGPIAHTSLTIRDLVPDSVVQVDADQNVTIAFTTRLFGLRLDTVLDLPDTTFFYRYGSPVPGNLTIQPGTPFYSQNNLARFDLQDVELQEMKVRSGELLIDVISMVNGETDATFQLPGASFNGAPVSLSAPIPAGTPASPTLTNLVRDLAGHRFDLRGPLFNDVNTLATQFGFATASNGNTVIVTQQDSLIAALNYADIVPQYARGYFGMRTEDIGPETVDVDVLGDIVNGTLDLDQVRLHLIVTNGIGVDIQTFIHSISGMNSTNNTVVDLQHAITSGPVNVSRATDLGTGFIPTVYSTELNNMNSNADLFLENLPDRLEFDAELNINPLGDISNGHDFLYYESEVTADLEIEIPLCIIATGLTLEDDIELNLPGTAAGHGPQNGTITLFATNGFPLDAMLSLDIIDGNGYVVNNLTSNALIPAGLVDGSGVVISPSDSQTPFTLTVSDVDLLYSTERIRISAVFNTADQTQHVKIRDYYKLDLQLVADFNYVVNGEQ